MHAAELLDLKPDLVQLELLYLIKGRYTGINTRTQARIILNVQT